MGQRVDGHYWFGCVALDPHSLRGHMGWASTPRGKQIKGTRLYVHNYFLRAAPGPEGAPGLLGARIRGRTCRKQLAVMANRWSMASEQEAVMMYDKAEQLKDARCLGGAGLTWGLALGFLGTAGATLRGALPRAHHPAPLGNMCLAAVIWLGPAGRPAPKAPQPVSVIMQGSKHWPPNHQGGELGCQDALG